MFVVHYYINLMAKIYLRSVKLIIKAYVDRESTSCLNQLLAHARST